MLLSDISTSSSWNNVNLTGTPTAPTPNTDVNSTQIATTAYVKAQGANAKGVAEKLYMYQTYGGF